MRWPQRGEGGGRHQDVERSIYYKNQVLKGVNRIFKETLVGATEETLGEVCLAVAQEITASKIGFIGKIGSEGLFYTFAISKSGWEAWLPADPSVPRKPPEGFHVHGIFGRVLKTGKSYLTNDPPHSPDRIGLPEGHPPLAAFLGVPLLQDDRVIGMIAVGNRDGGYRIEDQEALEAMVPAVVATYMHKRAESERKRSEAALRESEEKYHRIFENSMVGFYQSAPEGRFQTVNPAFARMLGYESPQDLIASISDTATQYYVDPHDRHRYHKIIQQCGYVENCEFMVRRKDGSPIWVSDSTWAYFDADGKVNFYEGVVIDITERKQAEKKFNEINATLVERSTLAEQRAVSIQQLAMELSNAEDRERQRLAGVLHDDFQQTLAYLKLKLNSLNASGGLREDLSALNTIIDGCIHRCRHLVYELSPPVLLKKGFSGALRQLCRQMKEMYALDVTLKMTPTIEIKSSVLSSMLIRSVRELLFNVVKHSGEKSALVDARVDGNQVLITVKDAGKGCDFGELKGKRDIDAGFGLFSIEDRVNFLGGYMQIESESGNGFCVTLWVPMDVSHPSSQLDSMASDTKRPAAVKPVETGVPIATAATGPPISVLLADDHELMREGLLKLLQGQEDIDVVGVAADGREAVQLAAQLKPDIVLMDVSMPVMDGIEATAHISKLLPAARIIGLTMHQDPDIRQAMLNAGACACLSKSGSPEELVKNMRLAHPAPDPVA